MIMIMNIVMMMMTTMMMSGRGGLMVNTASLAYLINDDSDYAYCNYCDQYGGDDAQRNE